VAATWWATMSCGSRWRWSRWGAGGGWCLCNEAVQGETGNGPGPWACLLGY
jgi:hypothetical protein